MPNPITVVDVGDYRSYSYSTQGYRQGRTHVTSLDHVWIVKLRLAIQRPEELSHKDLRAYADGLRCTLLQQTFGLGLINESADRRMLERIATPPVPKDDAKLFDYFVQLGAVYTALTEAQYAKEQEAAERARCDAEAEETRRRQATEARTLQRERDEAQAQRAEQRRKELLEQEVSDMRARIARKESVSERRAHELQRIGLLTKDDIEQAVANRKEAEAEQAKLVAAFRAKKKRDAEVDALEATLELWQSQLWRRDTSDYEVIALRHEYGARGRVEYNCPKIHKRHRRTALISPRKGNLSLTGTTRPISSLRRRLVGDLFC